MLVLVVGTIPLEGFLIGSKLGEEKFSPQSNFMQEVYTVGYGHYVNPWHVLRFLVYIYVIFQSVAVLA